MNTLYLLLLTHFYSVRFHHSSVILILVLYSVIANPSPLIAQDTGVTIEKQQVILSDSITLPAFTPESSADNDLGIQEVMSPAGEYNPFTLSVFTGYLFTDNANLNEINAQQDNIFWANIGLTYLPIIKKNLYGEITVRQQVYLYNNDSTLDFRSSDAGAGLVYVIRALGDVSTFLRYNYAYVDNYNQISRPTAQFGDPYQSHSIQVGFYKPWTLSRSQFLYLSYLSDINIDGEPSYAVRNDHSMIVGYRYHPVQKITADLFYRFGYLDFAQNGRNDWNNSAGGSISYHFTRNIYLAATLSYLNNNSNLLNADYKVWNTGLRLGGIFQF